MVVNLCAWLYMAVELFTRFDRKFLFICQEWMSTCQEWMSTCHECTSTCQEDFIILKWTFLYFTQVRSESNFFFQDFEHPMFGGTEQLFLTFIKFNRAVKLVTLIICRIIYNQHSAQFSLFRKEDLSSPVKDKFILSSFFWGGCPCTLICIDFPEVSLIYILPSFERTQLI